MSNFRGGRILVPAVALCFVIGTQARAQSMLTQHVPQVLLNGQAQFLSPLPATQTLRLDIVLPLSDPAGLQTFLQEVYNPTSPSYRHFLSVPAFTAQFGPSQADYDAVVRYATANGLTVYGGSLNGMDVQVEASVANIEAAFHVTLGVYQHPSENRTFYAPQQQPTVGLPFSLWHISGLDNYSIPQPMLQKSNANGVQSTVRNATTGSGPSAAFLGSDMRAAYYGGTRLTGAGQNLGLLEFYGADLTDVAAYFSNAGQTNNVPVILYSVDGTSTSCVYSSGCDDTEQTIDMTQALGMAPGLNSLVNFIGSSDTAIFAAITSYNPLPSTISSSWAWTPVDPFSLNPYLEKMAAQGQTFFTASGDSSTWTAKNYPWPAEAAYVVTVGGTDLNTTGAGGAWASETAWADSGGGISPDLIAIPAWQQLAGVINSSNKGSTKYRNGPDVAANANFSYYVCADQTTCTANEYGGTSFAAPLWAGYMALVNQQAALSSLAPPGFINPDIYSFGTGSGYSADFHDVTSGASGSYSAVTGYDLVTGWGSPNVGLLNALLAQPTSANFTLSAAPASVSVVQGSSGTSTVTTTVSGSFSSSIGLTASGQPTGVNVTFSPASISGAGTSTMNVTVFSTAATGTYPITVTGIGGGITQTSTVSLTVTSPGAPASFTLSTSPTSVSVAQGSSGQSTVTTAVSGGFSSSIGLSASGQPAGVTVTFSPASITGAGTSSMTMTVASTTAAGPYTITVTGIGGGITKTATVFMTVTASAAANFTLSTSPTSVSVGQGSSGTSTVTSAVSGGFSSSIGLSASGQPAGVTVGFSPASISGAGTSTMTMTVSSTAAAGTYTITVTGAGGGLTKTAAVSLTVTAPANFRLSAPTSVLVLDGNGTTATITSTVTGGFSSAITLSASGQPSGVTVTFNPPSITGAGTSTMTVKVPSHTTLGTRTVTITGTGGGKTNSTTVSLIIEP